MKRLLLAPLLLIQGAIAADKGVEQIPPELRSCISIPRNTERLACFDRGVGAILGEKNAVAPSVESSFGMIADTPPPTAAQAGNGAELQSVQARVERIGRAADESLVIVLDNKQSWKQLSGAEILLEVGDTVTIERAALGSFRMLLPAGRAVKVKRVR